MKAFVILNPVAGKNAREPVLECLKTHFIGAGIDYVVHETTKEDQPGDIVRARLKKEKFDFVVAAGGDGTASQVIDGLVGSTIPLGIIPVGTGNLLARDLGLPLKIDKAAALIAGTHILRKIDAMRINKRVCVLNASLGTSAKVLSDMTSKSKNRFGRLAYIWEVFRNLFTMKSRYITLDIDGETVKYCAVEAAVFNCGILAKTLYPRGPDIRIDDGHLDVWIVSFKTILHYPLYLFRMISERPSKHLSHFISANKSVKIKSSIPLPVQADGDIIGTTPIEIEVLPGAVTVFVSKKTSISSDETFDRQRIMSQYRYGYSQPVTKNEDKSSVIVNQNRKLLYRSNSESPEQMKKIIKWLIGIPIALFVLLAVSMMAGITVNFEGWAYSEAAKRMSPLLTSIMKVITHTGDPPLVIIVCLILLLVQKCRKTIALPVSLAVILSTVLVIILKNIFSRARPDILQLINETSYSFPSGHAMINASFYTMLIILIFRYIRSKPIRAVLSTICIMLTIAIGYSRIYLGVHYLGDVIGGWLIGFTVAFLTYIYCDRKVISVGN